MTSADLFCNFKRCHKLLTTFAWVTSCSHAFCEEHGTQAFERDRRCPACSLELCKDYDVVKTNLNPTEEFKSMVLAGLRPEIVLDMTARSLSFWSYQMAQDKNYHMLMAKHWRERCDEFDSSYQTLLTKIKNDREVENKKIESLQVDLDIMNKKNKELEERLLEKNRQMQTIQSKYESLRRSCPKRESDELYLNVSNRVVDQESFLQFRAKNQPPPFDFCPRKDFYFQPVSTLPED